MQASIVCRFGLLLIVTAAVWTSSAMAADSLPASPGAESVFVLKADAFKHYADRFNAMENENVVNLIPNAASWIANESFSRSKNPANSAGTAVFAVE